MFDDGDDDGQFDAREFEKLDPETLEELRDLGPTPIELAICREREMQKEIVLQRAEIRRLHRELAQRSSQLVAATERSSAWMLHAALNGAFTKKSVEAMGDMPADTVGAALVAAAANQPAK